jgi:glycosyltransferase involved in cell wall biosynthesis
VFPGTPYGPRQAFLSHPSLKGLLGHLAPPEAQTMYPLLFDGLQAAATNFAASSLADWPVSMAEYMEVHRRIRRTTFGMWLEGIRLGAALVNLPHPVKTYASRVYEGMAAGRPVLSWDLPDRPRNRQMFEPGSEILLFDRDAPEQLAEHIQRIQREPEFGARLADRALKKLRRFHTAEQRVKQILSWVETGAEPVYA